MPAPWALDCFLVAVCIDSDVCTDPLYTTADVEIAFDEAREIVREDPGCSFIEPVSEPEDETSESQNTGKQSP